MDEADALLTMTDGELRASSHFAALSLDDSSTVIVTLEHCIVRSQSRPLFLTETWVVVGWIFMNDKPPTALRLTLRDVGILKMRVSVRSAPSLVSNCREHSPFGFTLHCTEYGVKSDCAPLADLIRHRKRPQIGGGSVGVRGGGDGGRLDELLGVAEVARANSLDFLTLPVGESISALAIY